MEGKLLHLNGNEWEELHYFLVGTTLNVSRTDSVKDAFQKIEITKNTHLELKSREDNPIFVINDPELVNYTLRGPAVDVYSWFLFLKFCKSPSVSAAPEYRNISRLMTNSYGSATLCEHQNELYVILDISKSRLIAHLPEDRYISERNIILTFKPSPFLLDPCSTYQDDEYFHIWLEYPAGGELLTVLLQPSIISITDLLFYTAEVVVGLECVHNHHIVFRNLCPSNVLLSRDGHVKIGGYGTQKMHAPELSNTVFLAPEVVKGESFGPKADWWSLGVLLYQVLFDETPFEGETEEETKHNILTKEVTFRRFKGSPIADFITKLLEKDPEKRIDLDEIKHHHFFDNINWSFVESRMAKPEMFSDNTIDYTSKLASEIRLDSEMLPTSSAYYGLEGFSLGNDISSEYFNVKL